jgi:hypothetical protein
MIEEGISCAFEKKVRFLPRKEKSTFKSADIYQKNSPDNERLGGQA